MSGPIALLLASAIWSAVALVLGVRFTGVRKDVKKAMAELEAKQGLYSLVQAKDRSDITNLQKRVSAVEAPPVRKNVVF